VRRGYNMKEYDVIVVGSGCGMLIVDEAADHGLKVALVDKGPLEEFKDALHLAPDNIKTAIEIPKEVE
jgi:succinate dehydrogenase/fumarate reductase flavoprotein subunit